MERESEIEDRRWLSTGRSHDALSSTLDKWSTKIQAAAAQQANLGKANTKFTSTVQVGVVEAIENGLASRVSVYASIATDIRQLTDLAV